MLLEVIYAFSVCFTKVGVISTGNEVTSLSSTPLDDETSSQLHGTIYDINRPVLLATLQTYNAAGVDYGVVPDDAVQLEMAIRRALEECDMVITTGGKNNCFVLSKLFTFYYNVSWIDQ